MGEMMKPMGGLEFRIVNVRAGSEGETLSSRWWSPWEAIGGGGYNRDSL